MNPDLGLLAFLSLTALTIVPAVFVVSSRNLVHAGFWMLPCLIGVAGFYALLEAHFFVVVQVLVYIGAILVLIMFALMLTRDVMDPKERQTNALGAWAGGICGIGLLTMAHVLFRHHWSGTTVRPEPAHEQTVALGKALVTQYVLPFEAASVLLLAALIGAIVLAKSLKPVASPPGCDGEARRQ
jgi:NADH-quinone oxidoreductase subunit J